MFKNVELKMLALIYSTFCLIMLNAVSAV